MSNQSPSAVGFCCFHFFFLPSTAASTMADLRLHHLRGKTTGPVTAKEMEENKKQQEQFAVEAAKKLEERRRLKREIKKDFPKYTNEAQTQKQVWLL